MVVVCLIIVSLLVLSYENLTPNFEFRSSDLDLDHGLDTGPDLELDNSMIPCNSRQMKHPNNHWCYRDQPAISHTSDINEELGLVTHLFSDKTGTITKNEMCLKMFCNDSRVYCVEDPLNLKYDKFMQVLCLCHSVQVIFAHNIFQQ